MIWIISVYIIIGLIISKKVSDKLIKDIEAYQDGKETELPEKVMKELEYYAGIIGMKIILITLFIIGALFWLPAKIYKLFKK